MNTIPSCDLYDYLEIACLFHYQVKLELLNGSNLTGIAKNVGTNGQKQELFSIADRAAPSRDIEVLTEDLVSMTVLTPNARFQHVTFRQK